MRTPGPSAPSTLSRLRPAQFVVNANFARRDSDLDPVAHEHARSSARVVLIVRGVSDLGALAISACAQRSISPKHARAQLRGRPISEKVLVILERQRSVAGRAGTRLLPRRWSARPIDCNAWFSLPCGRRLNAGVL